MTVTGVLTLGMILLLVSAAGVRGPAAERRDIEFATHAWFGNLPRLAGSRITTLTHSHDTVPVIEGATGLARATIPCSELSRHDCAATCDVVIDFPDLIARLDASAGPALLTVPVAFGSFLDERLVGVIDRQSAT